MSFYVKLFAVYALVVCARCQTESDVSAEKLVNIPSLGVVKGRMGNTYFTQRNISMFYGINYAKPPSGSRRFLPPERYGSWTGTYDATKMRQRCPQIDMNYYPSPDPGMIDQKRDIEDCLVVNVFSPDVTENAKLPVLFFIHGGSMYLGSAYDFQPEFLLEEDIVLVVPQYRLGALGFLSLQTSDIPGNMGAMDIMLALQWVKDNIIYFGGDPSKVTVAGQSAGAALASSLLVSPLVDRGLFDKMIIQSGSVLGTWVIDEEPLESARSIAKILKCPIDDFNQMKECLKRAPALDLVKAQDKAMTNDIITGGKGTCGRSLVIQSNALLPFRYLTQHPVVAFTTNNVRKVPTLGGVTRDEGSYFLTSLYDKLKSHRDVEDGYLRRNVTRDLVHSYGYLDPYGILTDSFHNTYFKGGENQSLLDMLPGLMDMIGVMLLKQSTLDILRSISYAKPTYLYSFNFLGNISKVRPAEPQWDERYPFPPGVAHSDDLGYLFPTNLSTYTDREITTVKTVCKLWTNFVKEGSPASRKIWPQMSTPYGPYLQIGDEVQWRDNFHDEFVIATKEGFLNGSSSLPVCLTVLLLPVLSMFHSRFLNV